MRRRPLRHRSRDEQNAAFANMRSSGTYVRSRHNGHRHVTRRPKRVYQRRQPVERAVKVKPVEKKVIAPKPKKDTYYKIEMKSKNEKGRYYVDDDKFVREGKGYSYDIPGHGYGTRGFTSKESAIKRAKELDKKYPGTFNIRVKSSKGNVTQVAKTIPMSIEKKKIKPKHKDIKKQKDMPYGSAAGYAVAFRPKNPKGYYDESWEPVTGRKYVKYSSAKKVKDRYEEEHRKQPEKWQDEHGRGEMTKFHREYKIIKVDSYGRPTKEYQSD